MKVILLVALILITVTSARADDPTSSTSQTDADAVERTYEFNRKNSEIFAIEQKEFGVPRAAIASLIWIETKLGTFMGNVPVVGAFFSLDGG